MSNLKEPMQERLRVLDALASRIHENNIDKGFYEVEVYDGVPEVVIDDNLVGMKLALVHSEVTEILEAVRKSQGEDAIADEFADVLIRLLDLYHVIRNSEIYGVLRPLSEATMAKVEKNEGRAFKHGNKF